MGSLSIWLPATVTQLPDLPELPHIGSHVQNLNVWLDRANTTEQADGLTSLIGSSITTWYATQNLTCKITGGGHENFIDRWRETEKNWTSRLTSHGDRAWLPAELTYDPDTYCPPWVGRTIVADQLRPLFDAIQGYLHFADRGLWMRSDLLLTIDAQTRELDDDVEPRLRQAVGYLNSTTSGIALYGRRAMRVFALVKRNIEINGTHPMFSPAYTTAYLLYPAYQIVRWCCPQWGSADENFVDTMRFLETRVGEAQVIITSLEQAKDDEEDFRRGLRSRFETIAKEAALLPSLPKNDQRQALSWVHALNTLHDTIFKVVLLERTRPGNYGRWLPQLGKMIRDLGPNARRLHFKIGEATGNFYRIVALNGTGREELSNQVAPDYQPLLIRGDAVESPTHTKLKAIVTKSQPRD
ncbi:hypothetical protein Slin14017_G128600 [Septoria linicola]|nr:hypothetical protein Slin14017_G128600 [Septoria linicola]